MGFIKKIFRPNIPSVPSVPTVSVTGRDLVPSTSSKEPDSPQMGTDAAAPAPVVEEATQEPGKDFSRKRKKRGKASLMVDSTNSAIGSGGTGINL